MSQLSEYYKELGLSEEYIGRLPLPKFNEETRLILVDIGPDGREKLMSPEAAENWLALKSSALSDGLTLITYSAYRSFEYQFNLIRERIRRGETVEQVTQRLAPPGFSEHHSGRAVDITCEMFPHPTQSFDQSVEFRWLSENAGKFGFVMSYPKGNSVGIIYEPWHWCFHPV